MAQCERTTDVCHSLIDLWRVLHDRRILSRTNHET
jgi:hypothetical protein